MKPRPDRTTPPFIRRPLLVAAAAVFTLVLLDWARLRLRDDATAETAEKCLGFASQQVAANVMCIEHLTTCRDSLENSLNKARLILATKMQTIDLIKRSSAGDHAARRELEEAGWSASVDSVGRRLSKHSKYLIKDEVDRSQEVTEAQEIDHSQEAERAED